MTTPPDIQPLPPPGSVPDEGRWGKRIGVGLIVFAVFALLGLFAYVFATNERVTKQEQTITKKLKPSIRQATTERRRIQAALAQLDQDHSKPGIQLPRGARGRRGPDGRAGDEGRTGRRGARGGAGSRGGRGPDGSPGFAGAPGLPGPPGRPPTVQEIADAVAAYLEANPPPAGPPGPAGPSPTPAQVQAIVCQVLAPVAAALPGLACP